MTIANCPCGAQRTSQEAAAYASLCESCFADLAARGRPAQSAPRLLARKPLTPVAPKRVEAAQQRRLHRRREEVQP